MFGRLAPYYGDGHEERKKTHDAGDVWDKDKNKKPHSNVRLQPGIPVCLQKYGDLSLNPLMTVTDAYDWLLVSSKLQACTCVAVCMRRTNVGHSIGLLDFYFYFL